MRQLQMIKSLSYLFFFLVSIVLSVLFYNSTINAKETELDSQIVSTGKCSYSLTLTANASKEVIWQLWEDVENWKTYDTVIQYSYLENEAEFAVGATGYVKTKGAPRTKFELTEVDTGNSFVEKLKLPFWSSLDLKRRVVIVDSNTVAFTHEVEFKGQFKGLMYSLLAKRFKKDLKKVMINMKTLAEKQ